MEFSAGDSDIQELVSAILVAGHLSGEGHIPSSLSIIDIVYVTYRDLIQPSKKLNQKTRFILSKGHGSLALYAVLAKYGFINQIELETFGRAGSRLGGHPDMRKVPGVEASTGSLGHGLPIAVGIALSMKDDPNLEQVIVIVGDGEINEGSNWESLLLMEHHKLAKIKLVVDLNHSNDRAIDLSEIIEKFRSFNFHVLEVDGHDHEQISKALTKINSDKPTVIIANTIKGNRINEFQNNPSWHHRAPTADELKKFLGELE
jgi:transketolase